MAYDLHIVRTEDWLKAADDPIGKAEVDTLIGSDKELAWSTTDYVDLKEPESTAITRFFMVMWLGFPCFWWCRDQIICSSPSEAQVMKLVRIAQALNAFVIGDDGERYELRRGLFGKDRLVTVAADA